MKLLKDKKMNPPASFLFRLKARDEIDAVLLSSVASITYLTGYSNFAVEEREAFLLVTKSNRYIITDGRYGEAIKKQVPDYELIEISPFTSLDKIFKTLAGKHKIVKLGIEEDDLKFSEFKKISRIFKDIKPIGTVHRSIKKEQELEKIVKSCEIGDSAFKYILKQIKPGITEKDLSFILETFIRKRGAQISFEPIVAFGENSSVPHHHTGEKILEERKGQFILLDFGVKYQYYCSDMTRTIFWGKASVKQKEIYQTVLASQEKAVKFLEEKLKQKSIIKAYEVDKVAREFIKSEGFPTTPHSLGHGVGIQVHEAPRLSPKSKDFLKEGMVFSIEPGIYIPDFGGVRIEDLYTIKKSKLIQLTKSAKELIELT